MCRQEANQRHNVDIQCQLLYSECDLFIPIRIVILTGDDCVYAVEEEGDLARLVEPKACMQTGITCAIAELFPFWLSRISNCRGKTLLSI